jgi:histidine ammonia-lyase
MNRESKRFSLGIDKLDATTLVELGKVKNPPCLVDDRAWENLEKYQTYIKEALTGGKKIYGVNTGFGFLSDIAIELPQIRQLQTNLVRSHACGVGDSLEPQLTRSLLILRTHTLLLGHSGVRRAVVEILLKMLEHDILPIIPMQGSVGASGDLAPLAHLAQCLLGEGQVLLDGRVLSALEAFKFFDLKPIELEAKEGLALINGTHFMTTLAAWAVVESEILASAADICACLSLDACRGTIIPFDPRIHQLRPHIGQIIVAENVRQVFQSGIDEVVESHVDCGKVQDPYSFRCVPQVHGATRGVIQHVKDIIEIELNSVTDNPLIFDKQTFLSGGNFHGQPIAMAMDYLAIGVAELGSISERRTEKITNPHQSGLPPFVAQNSGLNSGFMIPHVVAASLVSENKVLCHPASVDSIPTSADKEDHVSMGPLAGKKARQVIQNCRRILAIEFLAASQGLSFLEPLKTNPALDAILKKLRLIAPEMEVDRSLSMEIENVAQWIGQNGPRETLNTVGVMIK